ncbi:hypothetical protein M5689_012936 [Euphorbia peplus]|nr:hypothetical protein M5689_012936 [Euphorbia peplus]
MCLTNPNPNFAHELIDPETASWNMDILNLCFMPSDVGEILKLKLSSRLPANELFWEYTRSGTYSIKSSYFLTDFVRFAGKAGSSSSSSFPPFRNKIWKIQLPTKALHFVWRLFKEILPTSEAFAHQGIFVERCCPLCHASVETNTHLFLQCDSPSSAWKADGVNTGFRTQ